MKSLNNLT